MKNSVDVVLKDENIWLSQKMMSQLYDVGRSTITEHISNVFKSNELSVSSVSRRFRHTAKDGKQYDTVFYNLELIIAIGYRVNSERAIEFRRWATRVLKDFTIRGYVLDKKRLITGNEPFDIEYFNHTLEEIREIRISERQWYQKVTDIYITSYDYDKNSPLTIDFFKNVQNKMHYAVHGNTAAELIYNRVNAKKEHMGLTSWENAPAGKIVKSDVSIAKNYLTHKELQLLQRIVSMYLDYAEIQVLDLKPMSMIDWKQKLDEFLKFNGRDVLKDAGKISHELAKKRAESEFDKYRSIQDKEYVNDLDMMIKKLEEK
ncbi:MAG: virulence RhuM family protein [Mycoplasmataceae bacterium]|nr:virulence RhuM family protein [Mycoplasmataceae bacterium]